MQRRVISLILSLSILHAGIAKAQSRSQQIERQCRDVIREVRAEIWQRHSVAVVEVFQRQLNASNYTYLPVNQNGGVLRRRYTLALYNDANSRATQRSVNFLSSPATMRTYSQKIHDRCHPVAMVSFGLYQTSFGVELGVDRAGRMFIFKCIGYGFGDPRNPNPVPWGRTICE